MTLILLQILGGVSLLLWGTRMLKLGFTRAYGTSLQRIIAANTSNRIKAFFAGVGVTAILQSSTATTMICASFASKKMIGTAAALAVIIGADVSTTFVAQVLTFDLSWLMPLLLILGIALHKKFENAGRKRHLARVLIGLGLILLSLKIIKESAIPLGESDLLPIVLAPLESEPVLGLIVSAGLTWLLHSSLAAILIIASLVHTNVIDLHLALLLALGANLGGAIIPYAMTLKMDARARRITTGNVIMRVTCVLAALPLLDIVTEIFEGAGDLSGREVLNFHTAFNIFLAILFLPLVTQLSKLCTNLVPLQKEEENREDKPIYLDETSLESPTIALASAARETLRVAKIVEDMFMDSMTALKSEDTAVVNLIKKRDLVVDKLHNEIKFFLTRVSQSTLDPKESDRFVQILSFSTSLEHVGDVIDNSLTQIINMKIKNKNRFSDEGFKEIRAFHQRILTNMKIAQAIFMSEDPKLAQQLVEGKKMVRQAAQKSAELHFERLREGIPETLSTSALHTDIIRDFRRINSYITAVAYTILDTAEKHKEDRKKEDITGHTS